MESEILSDTLSFADSADEILIISVDIGDGRKDQIKVHDKDNTDQLAIEFCSKHRLGAKVKLLLADEIDKSYQLAKQQQKPLIKPILNNRHTNSTTPTRSTYDFQENAGKILSGPSPEGKVIEKKCKEQSPLGQNIFTEEKSLMKKPQIAFASLNQGLHKKSNSQIDPILSSFSPNILAVKKAPGSAFGRGTPLLEKSRNTSVKSSSQLNAITSACRLPVAHKETLENHDLFMKAPMWTSEKAKVPVQSVNEQNEKYLKKLKTKRYKEIFELLSPDSKGVITKDTVRRSEIPSNLYEILSPLLKELEEIDENLNFQEFYDAMELLLKVLNPNQRNSLLMTGKHKTIEKEEEIKPKNIKKIESKTGLGLYERGLQKQKEHWRKIMQEKEEKEKAEMKECKFRPDIGSRNRKAKSTAEFQDFTKPLARCRNK